MELLNKLCDFCACSGNEKDLISFISKIAQPYSDEIFTDKLGNLYVRKKCGEKKIMISTSVDEAGFFATISDKDDIKIAKIGNIDVNNIKDALITFENGKNAIIKGETSDKIENYSVKVFCDDEDDFTGLTASFAKNFEINYNYITSKALSARIGVYVLLKILQSELKNYDYFFVFSVKKQIGAKGAKVIGNNVKPDLAVVLECFKGDNTASVILKDKSYVADKMLSESLVKCGFKGIVDKDYQSEGNAVQTSFLGIPTAVCGVGIENLNSRNEVCKINEIKKLIDYILIFLEKENVL